MSVDSAIAGTAGRSGSGPPSCSTSGFGCRSVARRLGIPAETVRKWQQTYRVGRKGRAADHGRRRTRDTTSRPRSPRRGPWSTAGWPSRRRWGGSASRARLRSGGGARLYREGGAEALRPKPKGRPKGSGREGRAEDPRGGARGARPQARGAGGVPKKIDSPEGGAALPNREKALAVAELSGLGHRLSDLLECAGLARSSVPLRARASQGADQARAARPRVAEIFGRLPNGVRPPAGRHGAAGRGRRPHRGQDGAQDDARDGPALRHPPRERLPQVQLVQGRRRRGLRERARPRLRGGRPVAEDGHRRHGVQAARSARPTSRRSTTSGARRSSPGRSRSARTSPSRRRCSPCSWLLALI